MDSSLNSKTLLVFGQRSSLWFCDYKVEVKMNFLKKVSDVFGVLAVLICLMTGLVRVTGRV